MNANDHCAVVKTDHDLGKILKTKDRIIALFYASWCPFCVKFLPTFKKYAKKEGQRFIIVQDDEETIADQYSVNVYPTILIFENGLVSKRLDGVLGVGLDEIKLTNFLSQCSLL